MRYLVWLVGLWLSLGCRAVDAEDIMLGYLNQPPFMAEAGAQGAGFTLFSHFTDGIPGIGAAQVVPAKRLIYTLQHGKVIALNVVRTPEREAMGLVWIGEVFRADFVFADLAGQPAIASYEDAHRLRHIGVIANSTPDAILRRRGFTNLDRAEDSHSQAAKLRAGHTDGWFSMRPVMEEAWRDMNFPASELNFGPALDSGSIWIVASPQVDPAIIATLRQRYEALRRDGKLAALGLGKD